MTTVLLLSIALGVLLAQILPRGRTAAAYVRPTEADFQELLRRRGLK